MLSANEFKDTLRRWFGIFPDKVTYGSDAFPIDDQIGAEQLYWFGVHNARTATAIASSTPSPARSQRLGRRIAAARSTASRVSCTTSAATADSPHSGNRSAMRRRLSTFRPITPDRRCGPGAARGGISSCPPSW